MAQVCEVQEYQGLLLPPSILHSAVQLPEPLLHQPAPSSNCTDHSHT